MYVAELCVRVCMCASVCCFHFKLDVVSTSALFVFKVASMNDEC